MGQAKYVKTNRYICRVPYTQIKREKISLNTLSARYMICRLYIPDLIGRITYVNSTSLQLWPEN